jgi:hypothetical protein
MAVCGLSGDVVFTAGLVRRDIEGLGGGAVVVDVAECRGQVQVE